MRKKVNIKIKQFDLPIYGAKITFVYGSDYDAIRKSIIADGVLPETVKDLEVGYSGYTFRASDENDTGYYYLIVVKDKDKYNEIDTITHEIMHLVWLILPNRDIKLNKRSEETYAYLTGHLNKEFFKFRDGKI